MGSQGGVADAPRNAAPTAPEENRQAGGRCPEAARDVQAVPRPGPGPEHCAPGLHNTQKSHVDEDAARGADVATRLELLPVLQGALRILYIDRRAYCR
jgi:hypothetical protein